MALAERISKFVLEYEKNRNSDILSQHLPEAKLMKDPRLPIILDVPLLVDMYNKRMQEAMEDSSQHTLKMHNINPEGKILIFFEYGSDHIKRITLECRPGLLPPLERGIKDIQPGLVFWRYAGYGEVDNCRKETEFGHMRIMTGDGRGCFQSKNVKYDGLRPVLTFDISCHIDDQESIQFIHVPRPSLETCELADFFHHVGYEI